MAKRGRPLPSFLLAASAIALLGTVLRVIWAETHGLITTGIVTDQRFYHGVANSLAHGAGYVIPGTDVPTADKPPLYPLLLAAVSVIGPDGTHAHRMVGPLLGGATILVLALLARRLGGDRIGIIAAALLALDVQLWVIDSQILSEVLYGLLLALVLLAAYRVREHPTPLAGLLLGVALGLAALTRPEAVVIAVLLGIMLLWTHRRTAVVPVALAAVACVMVIAPWAIRNWIVFDQPVFLSQQSAENLAGANCAATYYGRDLGSWRYDCLRPRRRGQDEPRWAASLRSDGLDYIEDHVGRVPVVVAARLSRTWGVRAPSAGFGFTHREAVREAVVAWLLLALAVAGLVVARRRDVAVGILLVPAITVTITAAVQFGLLRYRYSADLAFLVLGAFAVDAAVVWLARRRTDRGSARAGAH
jgi:4-amino-4-deoxy-L-arabinose transferase-like glycosyltransferase